MRSDIEHRGGKKFGKLVLREPGFAVGHQQGNMALAVVGVVDDEIVHRDSVCGSLKSRDGFRLLGVVGLPAVF